MEKNRLTNQTPICQRGLLANNIKQENRNFNVEGRTDEVTFFM